MLLLLVEVAVVGRGVVGVSSLSLVFLLPCDDEIGMCGLLVSCTVCTWWSRACLLVIYSYGLLYLLCSRMYILR